MNNRLTKGKRTAPCFDDEAHHLVSVDAEDFDRRMALDVVEDALTALGTPENCAFAVGLCGGLYICGLLSHAEWQGFLVRIPRAPDFASHKPGASA